jgi:hypothetical protein
VYVALGVSSWLGWQCGSDQAGHAPYAGRYMYTYQFSPHGALQGLTRYEAWHGVAPDLSRMRV